MDVVFWFVSRLYVRLNGLISLKTLKAIQLQQFLRVIHHSFLPLRPCNIVLPSFELRRCGQEPCNGIDTIAAETMLGPARLLSYMPLE